MPRYRVTISGKNYDAMADLVRKHKLNIAGHTGKKSGRKFVVDAFADTDQIERLKSEGYRVDVHEDVHEAGRRRQAEVRTIDGAALRNVATVDHYLNVADIEDSLAAVAAGPNASFARLIKLPNKTWEGRECHAIKIGTAILPADPESFFSEEFTLENGAVPISSSISPSSFAKHTVHKPASR